MLFSYIESPCKNIIILLCAFSSARSSENAEYWLCEFCNTNNKGLDNSITDQMKPLTADVTYELEPPPVSTTELNMGDNHNIVFVIDISVSMEHRKCGESTPYTFVTSFFISNNLKILIVLIRDTRKLVS